MVKFIGKRLAYAVLTLFLITTATFFLVAGAPGDPIAAKVGQMPEQAQQIIREKYGLDQPVVKRYTTYMKNLLTTGDFGESIIYTGQSANDIIKKQYAGISEDRFVGTTLPDNDWYMSWNGSGS